MSRQSTRIVTKFLPSVLAAGIDWLLNDSFNEVSTLYYEGFKARNAEGTAARDGAYTAVDIENAAGPYGGTSAAFDGTNSLCNIYTTSFRDAFDGDQGTVVIWAKVSGAGVWSDSTLRTFAILRADIDNRIFLYKNTDETVNWLFRAGGTNKSVSTAALGHTNWFCLALTWDRTGDDEMIAYLDGSQEGSTQTSLGTWAGNIASAVTTIGASSTTPGDVWDGNLAHCAVWTKALSAAQISAIYSGSSATILATEAANLIAYWPLQEVDVNGTAATPGPGTRTVVDTESKLSLSGGNASFAGGKATPVNGDPGLYLDALTRTAGYVLVSEVNLGAANTYFDIGWDTENAATGIPAHSLGLRFKNNAEFQIIENGIFSSFTLNSYASGTSYKAALVLRSTGGYIFIKGGIYSTWTLVWVATTGSDATVYPNLSNRNAVATNDFLRVPDATWLPTPLAYTLFAAANGTSLDALPTLTTGPDSQAGVTARSWTEQSGAWDIQSNRANPDGAALATVDTSQADIVVDLVVNGAAAGNPGIVLRFADTSNYWYLQADRANNQLELHEVAATVDTVRANAAVTINDSTDYTLRAICDGTTIDGFLDGDNKISYGSASLNQTETEHGLYSDNTACEFDDLAIFARDSGYSKLNSYTS